MAQTADSPSLLDRRGSSMEPSNPSSSRMSLAFRIGQGCFGLLATVMFFFGVTNNGAKLVGASGYDEVFTVLGSLFVFPVLYSFYEIVSAYIPRLAATTEVRLWIIGLRVSLVLCFLTQEGLLLTYMTTYVGKLSLLFLVPDIILVGLMLTPTKWTTFWTTLYILSFAAKGAVFWPQLDQSGESANSFASKDNTLGENGLLATLFLTIPIVQFPVLVSRMTTGSTIFEAYATNMAAVFAHTLHLLDTMELYFLGLHRLSFTDDVQYLILMFSVMGCVTCNLYYVALFFHDDAVENTLRRFQPTVVGVFAAEDSSKDETLLHYFVWMVFFIDLPYAAMRGIAWVVHGTQLSVFFAKNAMMMASVAMLIVKHSRTKR